MNAPDIARLVHEHPEKVDAAELLMLCAVDDDLYSRTFFPKTVRQRSPVFHRHMDTILASHDARFVAFEVFRGGAKTSKLRLFTSKRIAYGISHTILYVSNTQDHAAKSLEWIKRAVEFNTRWAQFYQLKPGSKWTGTDIEIIHGVDEYPIRIMALGITGQVRGVNVDDYRPDLIVVDDPDDEETTATEAQRQKTSDLFFGALQKSLAPASEAPDAKMVLLQTPLNRFDLVETCVRDPQWNGFRFGCFDSKGESSWPDRFTTRELMLDKQAHIHRNQLSLWMREMECTVVSSETSSFKLEWLKYFDLLPTGCYYIIAVDPASSTRPDADFFAIVVLAIRGPDVFLVEYKLTRGQDSELATIYIVDLVQQYRPRKVVCDTVGFQRTLATGVEKEMQRRRVFAYVDRFDPKGMKKTYRIPQALSGLAAFGHLHCRHEHQDFIEQFASFSPLVDDHDDLIDAVAMGVESVQTELIYEGESELVSVEESAYKALPSEWRAAP
jgi:hypothetical protein